MFSLDKTFYNLNASMDSPVLKMMSPDRFAWVQDSWTCLSENPAHIHTGFTTLALVILIYKTEILIQICVHVLHKHNCKDCSTVKCLLTQLNLFTLMKMCNDSGMYF